jgi:competence protein ComEC
MLQAPTFGGPPEGACRRAVAERRGAAYSGSMSIVGLLAAGLGWLLGVAVQLQQATLAPAWAPWAGAAASGGVLVLRVAMCGAASAALPLRWRPAGRRPLGGGLVGACLALVVACGLAWSSTEWRAQHRLAMALPEALEGVDLWVQGRVLALPQTGLTGTRFEFDVEAAWQGGAPVVVPPRLSLAWYRGFDVEGLLAAPAAALRAGERWRLPLRLKRPHGRMNPQGFDLELWLFERGILATGTVRDTPRSRAQRLPEDGFAPVDQLRQQLRERIDARVPEASTAGVIAALSIGDQAAIARDGWDLFRTTGVAHLISISGLHVTMFAWAGAALCGALWRRLPPAAMLAVPAPTVARWSGLVLAAAYAVLAGWGVPAQRTVWMIAGVVLIQQLGVRWPAPLVLLCAGVGVGLADPWALLQPGFWLSFVAVALLMASSAVQGPEIAAPPASPAPPRHGQRARTWAKAALRQQLTATVGLAPLTLIFFGQVSLVGFVANLVAIPWVTLLITPLALAGALWPGFWDLAAWAIAGLMWVLEALAALPGALLHVPAAPAWAAAAALLGGALAITPLPWRWRAWALPLMLPLLWPATPRPPLGEFELLAADVGQGTAVLLRTHNHLLVYDSGPAYSPESDAGDRVLLPLLRSRGERHIDLLMLSHRDLDHTGGAAALLRHAGVRAVSSSLEAAHPLLAQAPAHRPCAAGQTWAWDGVQFEVLHPAPGPLPAGAKPNTVSCVLRVVGRSGSALLTGDLEAAQELALVQSGAALQADLLLVPHHGSKTSSTAAFIAAVAPRSAVVQAGYRSRFGHPAPEVLARYAQAQVPVLRSDQCGALSWRPFDSTPGRPLVCQRSQARRYWHHPSAPPALP